MMPTLLLSSYHTAFYTFTVAELNRWANKWTDNYTNSAGTLHIAGFNLLSW